MLAQNFECSIDPSSFPTGIVTWLKGAASVTFPKKIIADHYLMQYTPYNTQHMTPTHKETFTTNSTQPILPHLRCYPSRSTAGYK